MADNDANQTKIPSESASEKASVTSSISNQLGMLSRTDPSISVPSDKQISSTVTETNQDPDATESFSGESSSTLVDSHTIVDASEDEEQTTDADSTAPLVPPRNEDAIPAISEVVNQTSEPPSCIQCACCCCINAHNLYYARKVRNSKYILLILIALLSIPISSIYFGVTYKDSCPMAQFSPLLLIIMGIVGVILIVVRLMKLSTRRHLWKVEEPPRTVAISLTFMLMVLMIIEMISFYVPKPVFDNPKNPVFCEKIFYDYVFYMNFVVLVTGILALMLHIHQEPRRPVQGIPTIRVEAV